VEVLEEVLEVILDGDCVLLVLNFLYIMNSSCLNCQKQNGPFV
jgi:hypothetical protein